MGRGQNGDHPLLPCLSKEGSTCPGWPKPCGPPPPLGGGCLEWKLGWPMADGITTHPPQPGSSPFSTEQAVGSSPVPISNPRRK